MLFIYCLAQAEVKEVFMKRKRVFSGIQPTGILHIGNYAGAVNNWLPMQTTHDCIFCIVDMHAITVRQEPAVLREKSLNLLAFYLACGLDPEKNVFFIQSHVHEHAELAWILNTIAYVGELSRMTQFKDKSQKKADNVNMGLMDYPVLMASDILLYKTDVVPVGDDQKQHLEITRDLAERFNARYGNIFTIPEPMISKVGARIYSLQEPTAKMSKSDENELSYIAMNDTPEVIVKKFKRAVTDSEPEIRFDPENKPGVSNLLALYSIFGGKSIDDAVNEFSGCGYGALKAKTAEAVTERLRPIQTEHKRLLADGAYLSAVLKSGAERAGEIAEKTLKDVYNAIGFVAK